MTNKTSFLVAMLTLVSAALLAKLQAALDRRVPLGYEDEDGFHYGAQPAPKAGK
jgi:hypothetical protein